MALNKVHENEAYRKQNANCGDKHGNKTHVGKRSVIYTLQDKGDSTNKGLEPTLNDNVYNEKLYLF